MANPENKHHISVLLRVEIHEMTPHGECRGTPIDVKKIQLGFDGINLADARRLLAGKLEEFAEGASVK